MEPTKCLDEHYIDFLAYLHVVETNGFKIYDLFNIMCNGEVQIAECYVFLAKLYSMLERSLGDPRAALIKLSELASSFKLASFLRGYESILFTSGDTRSFVATALKSEFSSLKAKIGETLRFVEVFYEAMLVVILCVSMFSVLPIWPLPPALGVLILQSVGLTGFVLSNGIARKLLYTRNALITMLEISYILTSCMLLVSIHYGLFTHLTLFAIAYMVATGYVKRATLIEVESLRVLNEVYSQIVLGESADIALLNSLKTTRISELKLVETGLLNGFGGIEILRKLKLPGLASSVVHKLVSLMHYSPSDSAYVASIIQFVDEVKGLRKYVEEKARSYSLYSLVVSLLLVSSYFMISRMPVLSSMNVRVLGLYGYISMISAALPACILKDQVFVGSKLAILVTALASSILLLFNTLPLIL